MDEKFEYDIAFSFLQEDEDLAMQLNDLLQDRFKTFIYSKAQEKLVGKDGENEFNAVFGEQARTVAVLYRPGWGESPWTRIEENAIKNRAYNHGYDFTTFIILDGRPPKYIPKTYIWLSFEIYGLDGAAAVLESRATEKGGEPSVESVADKAARLKRVEQFEEQKRSFRDSYDGVAAAGKAYSKLLEALSANAAHLQKEGLRCEVGTYGYITAVSGNGVWQTCLWRCNVANSLREALLVVCYVDGVPRLPGTHPVHDVPNVIEELNFTYELVRPHVSEWVGPDGKSYSSEALAEHLLKTFMDLQERDLKSRER